MIIQSYLQFSAQFHAIPLGNFSFKSFIILDYLFGPSWNNFSVNCLCLPHSPALFELADPFTKLTYESPCVQTSTNLIASEMRCLCIFYSYLLFLFLGFAASWIAEWFSPQFMYLVTLFTYKLSGACFHDVQIANIQNKWGWNILVHLLYYVSYYHLL